MSKFLTVFGATGTQGGSVVDAIVNNDTLSKQFRLRGITRDTSKPAAKALEAKGVELVKADSNNIASIQAAIRGSYAVFAVTNYWETADKDMEITQGKNIADACVNEHVHHLIWSSLPNVRKMTGGKLAHVSHFDSKATVEEYIRALPTSSLPVSSFFLPAFYMSNIKSMTRPGPNGISIFAQPWEADKTRVALLDTKKDTGNYIAGILLAPEKDVNKISFQGVSDWATPNQIVNAITAETGQKVIFKEVTFERLVQAMGGDRKAEELGENMLLVRDYKYFGPQSEDETLQSQAILPERPVSWTAFVKQNW